MGGGHPPEEHHDNQMNIRKIFGWDRGNTVMTAAFYLCHSNQVLWQPLSSDYGSSLLDNSTLSKEV